MHFLFDSRLRLFLELKELSRSAIKLELADFWNYEILLCSWYTQVYVCVLCVKTWCYRINICWCRLCWIYDECKDHLSLKRNASPVNFSTCVTRNFLFEMRPCFIKITSVTYVYTISGHFIIVRLKYRQMLWKIKKKKNYVP